MKAVITVIGRDTVGVVAKVSAVCAELNINIEDVSQSIMQDMFCMIMLVDMAHCNVDHVAMRERRGRRGPGPLCGIGQRDEDAGHRDPAGSL